MSNNEILRLLVGVGDIENEDYESNIKVNENK
jgi:hypothetical protein